MRPRTLKAAKHRAWEAISKHIRSKEEHPKCVTCGVVKHWKKMHLGHFIHNLTYALEDGCFYVLEKNLHPQCPSCNTYKNGALDHYTLYMIDTYGREFIDELHALKGKPLKMKIDDFWDIEKEYT